MRRWTGTLALALAVVLFSAPAIATPYPVILTAFASAIDYYPLSGDNGWTWGWLPPLEGAQDEGEAGDDSTAWGNDLRYGHADGTAADQLCFGSHCPVRVVVNFHGNGVEFWGTWGFWGDEYDDPQEEGVAVLFNESEPLSVGHGEYDPAFSMEGTLYPTKLLQWKGETGPHELGMAPTSGTVVLTHIVMSMEIEGT